MLNISIRPFTDKLKKLPFALLFAIFAVTFFLGDFFMLRLSAYSLPFMSNITEFMEAYNSVGVYAYMAIDATVSAALTYFICRMVVGYNAVRYAVQIDKKDVGVYLMVFLTVANLVSAIFCVLFIRYPYIFSAYAEIIRYIVLSVGLVFFAYCLINDFVPKKIAKSFFLSLTYFYIGATIIYTLITSLAGGSL
ncbi:MAG: hypothetical protein LBQ27_04915 [Clostridiales bacterium]|jgi:hypothetical protein|nr:hypothetical protein [Clostridiales bacterium]